LAYAQKDFTRAEALIKQTLLLAVELNDKRQQSQMLEFLGLTLLELGAATRAAQLLGAAKEMADSIEVVFALDENKLNDLKLQLGVSKYEALFAKGRSLTTEQALALAMRKGN
jgi:hypothetical protein